MDDSILSDNLTQSVTDTSVYGLFMVPIGKYTNKKHNEHKAILVGRDSITNPKVKGYKDQWGDRETWYDRNTAEVWYSIPKYPHNDNK